MGRRLRWSQGIFAGLTALWVLAFGGLALAATSPQVAGTVSFNGSPAVGASVSVVCTATGGAHTRSATTSSTGHFNVSFLAGQCDDGSSVTVTANSSDGSATGQAAGHMGDGGTSQRLNLDVGLITPAPVPEFSVLTATASIIAAGVLVLRLATRQPSPS